MKAVNLGEDADTVGAVYGQLAGAYYGERAIPSRWLSILALKDLIIEMADELLLLCKNSDPEKSVDVDTDADRIWKKQN